MFVSPDISSGEDSVLLSQIDVLIITTENKKMLRKKTLCK